MSKNSSKTLILVEICIFWQIIGFFRVLSILVPSSGRFCPFLEDFKKKSKKKTI